MRWRSGHDSNPQWRCWDSENFLFFNAGSGQTHQLNQLAADMLALIKVQPLTLPEISQRLSELYESLEMDDETSTYLEETIQLLDDVGLIEPDAM